MIEAVVGLLMFVNGEIKGTFAALDGNLLRQAKRRELILNLLLTNVGRVLQN